MHCTSYETLSQLVTVVGENLKDDLYAECDVSNKNKIKLITFQHEIEDCENNNKIKNQIEIPIEYSQLTSSLWYLYKNTDVFVIVKDKLADFYLLLNREILRIKLNNNDNNKNNNNFIIIDGFVSSISNLFSQFINNEKIQYKELNFRMIYLILYKIKELDKMIGFKIQINESNEIWELIDKIFLPCNESCDYNQLVEYLSNKKDDNENDKLLGLQNFLSLKYILELFGIKR